MKRGKKTITALSFVLGACVFVSTAFAEMALGTGYDRLKNAVKHTAAQMEDGLNNYTIETITTLKADGQTMLELSEVQKIDTVLKAEENTSVTREFGGKTYSHYVYSDPGITVRKSSREETYYVYEHPDRAGNDRKVFTNPFEQEGAQEIERIVDALVGNLKDYVQASDTSEGGKIYSGSLSSAQVPALVNAVSAFVMKQIVRDQGHSAEGVRLPEIEKDIYVSKISGTAIESEAGLLENLTGDVVLTGKDKEGVSHDIELSVMFKLSHIGATKVEKPDLTGEKVEKHTDPDFGLTSKHVGTYKNNIVLDKDGRFVKIGERTLEITSVEDGNVTGRFYETVKPEFAAEYPEPYNFEFESSPVISRHFVAITYTNAEGEQENGQLHPAGNGKIYAEFGLKITDSENGHYVYEYQGKPDFDGEMIRVFED